MTSTLHKDLINGPRHCGHVKRRRMGYVEVRRQKDKSKRNCQRDKRQSWEIHLLHIHTHTWTNYFFRDIDFLFCRVRVENKFEAEKQKSVDPVSKMSKSQVDANRTKIKTIATIFLLLGYVTSLFIYPW